MRGYSLMQGLHKVERERVFDADGFYHTGDGGYFDADGVLFFQARLGDMIKTAGANVTPREVEVALETFPEVQAAFVVGLPDPARGQNVAAAVVLQRDASLSEEACRERLARELSAYKVPRRWLFCEKSRLPFTDSGKIDKRALVALFEADIAEHNANLDNALSSEVRATRMFDGGIMLADGDFELKDKDGALLLGGKWGCVYRQTDEGLEVVMESAHVAKDTLKEPIDFAKVERQAASAADFGDAGTYVDAMNNLIAAYGEGMKAGDAAKIAGLFTEDGIQLVGSSSEPHRGRAAIQAALKSILPEGGYAGTDLEGTILGMHKVSDNLLCANGQWQVAGEDGAVLEFGQWGNLMEIQDDGSLLLIMESAGPLHVAK